LRRLSVESIFGNILKGKEKIMHDKSELCEKIRAIYPDIGECGIDVDVDYSEEKKAWVVDLKHGEQHLSTQAVFSMLYTVIR
jgi:hypothetical protein